MSAFRVIVTTSCKGGVGKSTVCVNLAKALAQKGKLVLLIDFDLGMRCLDLMMGLENQVVYDLYDVALREIPLKRAVVYDRTEPNLMLLAAPYGYDEPLSRSELQKILAEAAETLAADFVIIDTPGGIGEPILLAAEIADEALIVANHSPASIKAAERTNTLLAERGVSQRRLVINFFDAAAVRRGELPGVISIIDKSKAQLIGVIPKSEEIPRLQRSGLSVEEIHGSNEAEAFENIALRILGRNIRLLQGFRGIDRKVLLK